MLGDEIMVAALIDRLLHPCHIVRIRGNSYRMRAHQDILRPPHEGRYQKTGRDQPPTPLARRASRVGLRALRSLRPTRESYAPTPEARPALYGPGTSV